MIELFIVGSLVAATVRTAKGRGSSPWLYGSVAVVGFLLIRLGVASVFENGAATGSIILRRFAAGFAPYVWLVLLYFYVRFVPGRLHEQPSGQWTCPEGRWLNSAAVFKCEACGHEYHASRMTT